MVIRGDDLKRPTYKILQTLHEGNVAICYLAYHDIFEKPVVQKTVSLLGLDDAVASREPKLLDQLEHKHLVQVRDAQWDPEWSAVQGVTFMMPYYEGGSVLSHLLDGYRFSLGEAVRITCHVLDALHYLHAEKRIVHRDVKPSNVFLSQDKRQAYLGDLGSAAEMDEQGAVEAKNGTPLYMPPEYSKGALGATADIYAVGMMLLEMVNGKFPYEKIDEGALTTRNDSGKRPLSDRFYVPEVHVPGPLSRVIRQMISANPARRPQSAAEAQRALEKVPHLDWREQATEDAREVRVWIGCKVHKKSGKTRHYCATARPVKSRNADSDQFELSAGWKQDDMENWRAIRSIGVKASLSELDVWRKFFKDISDLAHKWAER